MRFGASSTPAGLLAVVPRRPVSVLVSVAWRSASGQGLALVRIDAVVAVAPGHPYGRSGWSGCDVHLWADPDAPGTTDLAECADVLVSRVPLPWPEARRRVGRLLTRHPGCLVAAVPDTEQTCVIGVRDTAGGVRYARPGTGASCFTAPPHTVASAVHAWSVAGGSLRALRSVRPRAAEPPGRPEAQSS